MNNADPSAPLPAAAAGDGTQPSDDDLARWFDAQPDPGEAAEEFVPDAVQRFRITNDDSAEWALRKLAAIEQDAADTANQYRVWIDRLERDADKLATRSAFQADYFRGILSEYAEAQRAEGRKTVALPSGTVGTRYAPAQVIVTDEAAFVAWAEAADLAGVVQYVRTVSVTDVRKALTDVHLTDDGAVVTPSGEIVPGLGVRPENLTMQVKAR